MTTTNALATPRIYVASLSDYNAGRLHGAWIDVTDDPAETWAAITAMLATSQEPGAEEWAIHDHDGWAPFAVSEYANIEALSAIAAGIIEYGPAFAAWADNRHSHHPVAADINPAEFEDAYCGEWESLSAYAEALLEDSGIYHDLEKHLGPMAQYCQPDLEQFAHDLRVGGDNYTTENPDGGVWVFRNY